MTDRDHTSTAAAEREALVRALAEAGSEAETLCEGWNAHDLAVHIAARDARPDTLIGQHLPIVSDRAKQTLAGFEQMSFDQLLDRIRQGVPRWSPARLGVLDEAMNTLEFYVHTEDVLRAGPDYQPASRRAVSEQLRRVLWRQASATMFRAAARKARRRTTFLSPGYGAVTHGRASDLVRVVEGAPEELVLWAFGRERVAEVSVREA